MPNPTPRIVLLAGLAGFAVLVACADSSGPVETLSSARRAVPGVVTATLSCTASVASGAIACRELGPGGGPGSRVILSGPDGGIIDLESSNVASTADTFGVDVTVLHRIVQPLGTTDGTTAHVGGVRVFFSTPPYVVTKTNDNALAWIGVNNPDGSTVFEGSTSAEFFQYNGLLVHNTTSEVKRWRFNLINVATFAFEVKVWGEVKYPNGWTTLTPSNLTVPVNDNDQIRAVVRDVYGQAINDSVSWTSSNTAVLTVVPTARQYADVYGHMVGTAWVKAVSVVSPTVQKDSVLVTIN
jgi:hypothetical protein